MNQPQNLTFAKRMLQVDKCHVLQRAGIGKRSHARRPSSVRVRLHTTQKHTTQLTTQFKCQTKHVIHPYSYSSHGSYTV